jgi:hypothetical protein
LNPQEPERLVGLGDLTPLGDFAAVDIDDAHHRVRFVLIESVPKCPVITQSITHRIAKILRNSLTKNVVWRNAWRM